jgi:uncharacterized protein
MEDFIAYIIKNIVDAPEAVQVACKQNGEEMILEVRVAEKDIAKVIGRKGKTIQSLRTIVATAAARLGFRFRLELAE